MKKFKHTKGDWETRGNTIFIKGTFNKLATVCVQKNYEDVTFKPIEDIEAIANVNLMAASPRLLKSLIYAKSLIDKLEESHPEIAHKLMGVDEMIEIEKIINELNR